MTRRQQTPQNTPRRSHGASRAFSAVATWMSALSAAISRPSALKFGATETDAAACCVVVSRRRLRKCQVKVAFFASAARPNPGAPVPPLVPSAKKARFRILLYTGPYYKAFYVPATSIGRSARLFLVIQKENLKKFHFPYVKQGRENQPPFGWEGTGGRRPALARGSSVHWLLW